MKRILIVLAIAAALTAGCNKNKQGAATAASSDDASSTSGGAGKAGDGSKDATTKVATGEMRELLLALKRVHFPFDSSTLAPSSKRELDDAAEKLRAMTDVALYVDGHTDERGTTEYNMSLGERRARTVVDYLKSSGVDPDRLSIVSFGEEEPLVNGSGDRENAMNRRVEYRLMKGNVQFVLEEGELLDDNGSPI